MGAHRSGDLSGELLETSVWSDSLVSSAGIPLVDKPFVTIGGGVGSLAMVDHLRVAGVPTQDIAVLTGLDRPWETYRYLATNSQIPDHERIRSDSGSVIDNIWGFPSYALREAVATRSPAPLWQVLTEPLLADYYTPRAGDVYRSIDRETARIGWSEMVHKGQVRMVRRRHGGGYHVLLTPPTGSAPTARVAYRCRWVHVAIGYPGVRVLDDLQRYRAAHNDYARVVNAYEPHPHVYAALETRPCTVLVRGSGIVASRVLQRLLDDREAGRTETTVVHLFRNYVSAPEGPPRFRRPGRDGFALQAFNYPKAAWGGQLRDQLLALADDERASFIRRTGGTNTAPRRSWRDQLARCRQQGIYHQHAGEVDSIVPGAGSTVVTRVRGGTGMLELSADFIIDATGLEGDVREHRLLADLLDHSGAVLNPLGRLDVGPDFEVRGTRWDPGRMYASGTMTLGGPYAPVDSFLGLQYAALQITDELARQGFGQRIGVARSVGQWLRWMLNRSP